MNGGESAGVAVTVTPTSIPPVAPPTFQEPRKIENSDTMASASEFDDEQEDNTTDVNHFYVFKE